MARKRFDAVHHPNGAVPHQFPAARPRGTHSASARHLAHSGLEFRPAACSVSGGQSHHPPEMPLMTFPEPPQFSQTRS